MFCVCLGRRTPEPPVRRAGEGHPSAEGAQHRRLRPCTLAVLLGENRHPGVHWLLLLQRDADPGPAPSRVCHLDGLPRAHRLLLSAGTDERVL